MSFKQFVCGVLNCADGMVPAGELVVARTELQSVRSALEATRQQVADLRQQTAFLSKSDGEKLEAIKLLKSNEQSLVNERKALSVQNAELRKQIPERETEITKTILGRATLLDGYVFHTARPVYIKNGWKAQHFDVRRFYFDGDWSLIPICQLIADEYKPTNPHESLLAVLKWQAKNVTYMTDEEKWREGDNWSFPHEVLLTMPGTYPKDKTYYDLLKEGKLEKWYYDDCESKSHLTKALCTNMKYVDPKLAIPEEWVWVSYGMWSGFGHSWVVYWDATTSVARIYEATASVPPSSLQSGFPRNTPSYDEYFFNSAKYVAVNLGRAVVFG